MYAKYVYSASSSIDNIMGDIAAIITGETTKSNLSADCDQTNTDIRTTLSTSPWLTYDDEITALDKYIMRLEMDDDSGVYKYVNLQHDGVDDISFTIMASWNTTTNAATDETPVSAVFLGQRVEPTPGGTMHIYASQYAIVLMHKRTVDWYGQFGTTHYGSVGVLECDRLHPSMAVGDMPNYFVGTFTNLWAGDSGTNHKCYFWQGRDETNTVIKPMIAEMGYQGRDAQYNDTNSYPLTGLGTSTALTGIGADTQFALEPIVIGGSNSITAFDCTTTYGDVSSRCDIWFMPYGSNNVLDLVHVGNTPYIIFKAGYTTNTTGTAVGGKFVVPYG